LDQLVTYVLFKTMTAITGLLRMLLVLVAIVGAGYWSMQGEGIEWLLAAVLVLPGILAFVHFRSCNFLSETWFDRPYRTESFRRSVNFGIFVSMVGTIAILIYRYAWA
jgi:hypothetical protein